MWWRRGGDAQSFAGESQRRALPQLARTQPRALAHEVVARHRDHALPLGQLQLDHHHRLLAERHFGSREIELPHARETGIVETFDLLAMGQETRAPELER